MARTDPDNNLPGSSTVETGRRVPPRLWLAVTLGNNLVQVGWLAVAATQWIVVLTVSARAHPAPLWDSSIAWTYGLGAVACAPFLAIGVQRARRDLRLLRDGRETRGKLLRKTESYSNKTVTTRYVFAYTTHDGSYHETTVTGESPHVEDERTEAMLYDPHAPDDATTVDSLPGYPTIVSGRLIARKTALWGVFMLPVLALVAAGWTLLR